MKQNTPAQTFTPPYNPHKHSDIIVKVPSMSGTFVPPQKTIPFSNRKDLPIRGRAQGGEDGNLLIEEHPIDWTYRPADLQGIHGAFAVFVTGDSMLPKYKNQDLAYIHPSQRLRKGRYVLVETDDHHGFIKQFEKWDGDTLVLKQFNPAKAIKLPRQSVRKIMLVIGSLDA